MRKRMIQMLAIVIAVIGILGFIKFKQISAAIAAGKSWSAPPEAVTTQMAQRQDWQGDIEAVGSVAPVQGVTLSADLAGVVDKIDFRNGAHVQAGQTLVQLDTRQERAQLAAAQAARDLAKTSLDRSQKLLASQAIAQADFDQVSAQYKQAEASVGQIQATIDRKTIRAPFAGVTGIRSVNLGQYLNSGDAVVPLQSLSSVYINFDVPQQQVSALHLGDMVSAEADTGTHAMASGRITAINPVVDNSTRNVQVQATFGNKGERMKPGMYVSVKVALGNHQPVIALPISAINYAPYGNSVFIVEDIKGPDGKSYKGVRQQFVKLGGQRGDMVAVLDGVTPGQEVVTSGVFKLRSGAAVTVNNKVTPSATTAPKPENS